MSIDPIGFAQYVKSFTSDGEKQEALEQAFNENRLDFVRAFINLKSYEKQTNDRSLALRVSIGRGHIPIALEIINLPYSPEQILQVANAAYYRRAGSVIMSSLIDKINSEIAAGMIFPDELIDLAIVIAAKIGDIASIKFLLKKRREMPDDSRCWAAAEASSNGHFDIVNELLGERTNIRNEHLDSALGIAILQENWEMAAILALKGAQIKNAELSVDVIIGVIKVYLAMTRFDVLEVMFPSRKVI